MMKMKMHHKITKKEKSLASAVAPSLRADPCSITSNGNAAKSSSVIIAAKISSITYSY